MIIQTSAKGYKWINKYTEIEYKPITIFLGPNNSGKSAILSQIALLAQTIRSYDNKSALVMNGEIKDFGSYNDIVFGNRATRNMTLGISFEQFDDFEEVKNCKIEFDLKNRMKKREVYIYEFRLYQEERVLLKMRYNNETDSYSYIPKRKSEFSEYILSWINECITIQNFIPGIDLSTKFMDYLKLDMVDIDDKYDAVESEEELNSINEMATDRKKDFDKRTKEVKLYLDLMNQVNHSRATLNQMFNSMNYVSAARTSPKRTYMFSDAISKPILGSGENAIPLLAKKINNDEDNIFASCINKWLNDAGLAKNLKINQISNRHYEVQLQHPKTEEYENVCDVGFGVSQILPVLIAGYSTQEGGVFIVEEPEIHMHPRAQAQLGEFFYELYENKIQSIIETHSEHLVMRLQKLILTGKIKSEDVIFYYVYSEKGSPEKVMKKIGLDELAYFTEEWPEDFFPELANELMDIMEIRAKKE